MIERVIAIVTGSRDWTDRGPIEMALFHLPYGVTLYHGAARGADRIASQIAKAMQMPQIPFVARWPQHLAGWCRCESPLPSYCPAAGIVRNRAMRDAAKVEADKGARVICLAFPLPQSKGTLDMIKLCQDEGWEIRRYAPSGEVLL